MPCECWPEKAMATHSSTLAWKIPWTEEPVGCSPWGREELHTTEWLHFHFSLSFIGEGNGSHPSVLAWRIPGTGEPGGLLSMESHRVGHDWSNLAAAAASHSVGSLFIFLVLSFTVQSFLFEVVLFAYFYFCISCSRRQIQKTIAKTVVEEYTAYIFF